MYQYTQWLDHVEGDRGEVIQEGTLFDQENMNKIEQGINDATLATAFLNMGLKQLLDENETEVMEVTIANSSNPWPFNRTPKALALQTMRNNTEYQVQVEVLGYTGGKLGDIQVWARAKNGFKLAHEGSAKTVTARVTVKGGMLK